MQIRPVSPSFKGYVEAKCKENLDGSWKDALPVTFNTNSITYSPNAAKECLTEVHCGNNRYFVNCIYDRFQEACLLSDSDEMKGKVVKVMTWLN